MISMSPPTLVGRPGRGRGDWRIDLDGRSIDEPSNPLATGRTDPLGTWHFEEGRTRQMHGPAWSVANGPRLRNSERCENEASFRTQNKPGLKTAT